MAGEVPIVLQLRRRFPGLPTVGIQRVTDDEPLRQPLLVGLAAVADSVEYGQDSWCLHRCWVVLGQVGCADDPCHAPQRLVGDLVLVDQGLQRAAAPAMAELGAPE